MKRLACCLGLAALLLFGCDDSPDELTCETDPARDCCLEFPDRPECQGPPTCADDPSLPFCSCEPDAERLAPLADCEADPLAPHCVPPEDGPTQSVEVARDGLGIAHVTGLTDADAFWGSGYMQAADRLGQMDLVRRQALGRSAEVFGERKVEDDRLIRTVDIAGLTQQALDLARAESPESYALLVAWTQGVNAYIARVNAGMEPVPPSMQELGYMPEPWAIRDGAAAGKLLLFGSSNQIENDILATVIRDIQPAIWRSVPLVQPLSEAFTVPQVATGGSFTPMPPTLPAADRVFSAVDVEGLRHLHALLAPFDGEGSNNWAVDGRHTANGRPLIAGDPHQGLNVPSRFYAHHFRSLEGQFDVAGWAFVGAPGIILGHNQRVVWTATLNYPDMMDLWDVRADPSAVRVGGVDRRVVCRTETIEVAGGDPVEAEIARVPGFGVLLPEGVAPLPVNREGGRLLFNWTGFTPTNDVAAVVGLNTAQSVDEFEAAADRFGIGAFNWVAADANDILYVSSVWVPERAGLSRTRPPYSVLDGDRAEDLWLPNFLPRSLLPRSRGGARGYVGTANNDPLGFTADGDPTNDAFYFGAFFDPGTRAQRVYDELDRLIAERSGSLDVADMQTLQTDTHSIFADRLLPMLEGAWSRLDSDPALAEFRDRPELVVLHDLLAGWDRRMQREQAAPVVFTGLLYFFARVALADELALVFQPILDADSTYLLKFPILAAEGAWDGSQDLLQGGVDRVVLEALSQTDLWLTNIVGVTDPTSYTWGELHCTRFGAREGIDAWSGVPCTPTDGAEGTVNVSAANILRETGAREDHRSGGGAIYRLVATFGADGVPEATVNFPPGNVEDPSSPYWTNTLEDWVEDRYQPFPYREADVDAAAVETFTLVP